MTVTAKGPPCRLIANGQFVILSRAKHNAFVTLGCAIICWRRLHNHSIREGSLSQEWVADLNTLVLLARVEVL
jgi:hypothetical protein